MFLDRWRKRVVKRVITALLAAIACGGAIDWGHVGGDDADCDVQVVRHDHNAHRFHAPSSRSSPASDHCYICHSLRLFHTAIAPRGERITVALRSARIRLRAIPAHDAAVAAAVSSRAPPAITL